MANIYSMVDTWNDAGTTFTGIGLNVTDTASNAASLLMDLQVGGASQLRVGKDVGIRFGTGQVAGASGAGLYSLANTSITFGQDAGSVRWGGIAPGGFVLSQAGYYGWGNTTLAAPDLFLLRDAANTLAQRNGTNAQTFNLYNTYTDASNYERGFMKWNSNVLEIGTEAAGTGTGRDVLIRRNGLKALEVQSGYFGFYNSAGTRTMLINSTTGQFNTLTSGRYGFGAADTVDAHIYRPAAAVIGIGGATNTGGSAEFKEIASAPAAVTDAVRIYAEDNGSGKTRLMALFPTGAAQQIAIEP